MMSQENCSSISTLGNDTQWFAVSTTPRHEKRVSELMTGRNIETFLPVYRTERQWKKRPPVTLELPLFPSYVFVRVPYMSRGRVLSTPGVLSFVGNGRHAIAIPDAEINALRNGIEQYRAEPHVYFAFGEKVKVKTGPLSGFTGTLIRQKTGARVVLTIDAIMQGVAVEIDLADLESAESPARRIETPEKSHIM
jgi:transcription antitermination factor NusG